MNLNQYLATFGFGTAIAWAAWAIVLTNIDPTVADIPGFLMFYVTLFIGLVGLFTTIATLIRVWRTKQTNVEGAVSRSLRQSFMLSSILITALVLAGAGLLTWLIIIFLVILASLVEFFFLSRTQSTS